jgi:transcriptional regulator with XRE-family HTH domain
MVQSTHNPDYQLLLTVLKAARKRMGVSQVELAARLGNTQTFVSKCERGERRIDAVELVEFSEALGVPPLELIRAYLEQRTRGLLPKDRKTRRGR